MLDITYRAVNVLKDLKFLLVEDTRRTSKLLNEYNVLKKYRLLVKYEIANIMVIPKIRNLSKTHNVHAASSFIISK